MTPTVPMPPMPPTTPPPASAPAPAPSAPMAMLPPAPSHTSQFVILGVAAFVATASLAGWWYAGSQEPLSQVDTTLATTTPAENASVADEVNVDVDTTDQTNPFTDDYVNPFE